MHNSLRSQSLSKLADTPSSAVLIALIALALAACSTGASPTLSGAAGSPCQTDSECLNGSLCVSQVCTEFGGPSGGAACQTTSDCATGSVCVSGTCKAYDIGGMASDSDAGNNQGDDAGQTGGNDAGTGGDHYCQQCTTQSECGGGGNYCLAASTGSDSYCGIVCDQQTNNCPAGSGCYALSGTSPTAYNCFPTTGTCANVGTPDAGHTNPPDAGNTNPPDAGHTPDAGNTNPPDAGQMTMGGPAGSSFASCATFTWAACLEPWFSSTCFSCHQHSGETESWVYGSESATIEKYIGNGTMPQGSTDPNRTADEAAIKTWIANGHP